jgi:hypothetical protein
MFFFVVYKSGVMVVSQEVQDNTRAMYHVRNRSHLLNEITRADVMVSARGKQFYM